MSRETNTSKLQASNAEDADIQFNQMILKSINQDCQTCWRLSLRQLSLRSPVVASGRVYGTPWVSRGLCPLGSALAGHRPNRVLLTTM